MFIPCHDLLLLLLQLLLLPLHSWQPADAAAHLSRVFSTQFLRPAGKTGHVSKQGSWLCRSCRCQDSSNTTSSRSYDSTLDHALDLNYTL